MDLFRSSVLESVGRRREAYFLSLEDLRSLDFNQQKLRKEPFKSVEEESLQDIRHRRLELESRLNKLKEEYNKLASLDKNHTT